MKKAIDLFYSYLEFALVFSVVYWGLTLIDKYFGCYLGGALNTLTASAIAWWSWQWSTWRIRWTKVKETAQLLLVYFAGYSVVFFIGSLVVRYIIFDHPQRILFFYHYSQLLIYGLTLISSMIVFGVLHCLPPEMQKQIYLVRHKKHHCAATSGAGEVTASADK